MGDSKKHRKFASESLHEKPASALAGIGDVHGKSLSDAGFDKAYKVFGQYLVLGKDETRFKKWLAGITTANRSQQDQCYRCLRDWTINSFE